MLTSMAFTTLLWVSAALPAPVAPANEEWSCSSDNCTVTINSLELIRFHGELESPVPGGLVEIEPLRRAIICDWTLSPITPHVAPYLVLANGRKLQPKIVSNQRRQGIVQLVDPQDPLRSSTTEHWYEVPADLALNEIFPCDVVIEIRPAGLPKQTLKIETISP